MPGFLLGFTGPAGSGKDTCGSFFIEKYGFKKLSFASTLKAMLATAGLPEPATQALKEEIVPWLGVSWRHAAQTLGTEWGRTCIHPDLWILTTLRNREIALQQNPELGFVVTDVRFENEARAIRDAGGWVVHLEGRKATLSGGTKQHASESGIVKRDCDFSLDNSVPLEHLRAKLVALHDFLFQPSQYKRWKCSNSKHAEEFEFNPGSVCPVCKSKGEMWRVGMVAR